MSKLLDFEFAKDDAEDLIEDFTEEDIPMLVELVAQLSASFESPSLLLDEVSDYLQERGIEVTAEKVRGEN